MCPMLPITLIAIVLFALIELTSAASSQLRFEPKEVNIPDGSSIEVFFSSLESPMIDGKVLSEAKQPVPKHVFECDVTSSNQATAIVEKCEVHYNETDGQLRGKFVVHGDLLGHASAQVSVKYNEVFTHRDEVPVTVILHKSIIQRIFLGSVILLVSLNYVNMGCAIDLHVIQETVKKPIGPLVGLFSQFAVMPLLSYFVASNFLDEPYLKISLFTFGCSPGGGASNMWTVLLGGNLDLSVTMTFLSTVAALIFMPLWLFTLGKSFLKETAPKIPYMNIVNGIVGMVIPLGIGLIMQRYCPKGTAFCRKILTPFSVVMIIFIAIFGTYANLYMLRLITWQIAFAAAINVWTGFLIGIVLARIIGMPWRDAIAVMVETGVQNTGVAIILLSFSLPKPDGDMAGIVPVAASTITPIPLTILWLVMFASQRSFFRCPSRKDKVRNSADDVKFHPIENA